MTTDMIDLKSHWNDLLLKNPRLRIRDAADVLKVSEAELLATLCGETVTRLAGNWSDFLQKLPHLGEVMCLTRNQAAVHERLGTFIPPISFFGKMGQVTGPEIDLRLFMSHWHFGFAVRQPEGRNSFQFFDQDGTAVHKVYLTKQSSPAVYEELVQAFYSPDQSRVQPVVSLEEPAADCPDAEIDVGNFQKAWLAATDTHEFHGMIKKFRLGRQQALRLAPEGVTRQVPLTAIQKILEMAAFQQLPIMVFVGSPGCLQIHTGPIQTVKRSGKEWLNILDERFSFHLNESLVASVWVVKKTTKDGVVTSLELFDAAGKNLALFFGKRKPGQSENPAWQEMIALL